MRGQATLPRLCLPRTISGRNGGAAQTRLEWQQPPRSVGLSDLRAHPCPAPRPHRKKEFVAGAPPRRPAPGHHSRGTVPINPAQELLSLAAAFTSCPRSVVVFATLAVLRPSVVQTPTANPMVAALARDRVTTDYRS